MHPSRVVQARSSWYAAVRDHLASWGYIVVQYYTPFWRLPSISDEIAEFPVTLSWLERENHRQDSPLYSSINTSSIATAGHSRGGKVACLLYSKYDRIQSAWLIDPVDGLNRATPSKENPSGIDALKTSGKRVGIAGAGIVSSCNACKEGNFASFYNSSMPGSWVVTLSNASHSSFANAGSFINILQDLVCGKSRMKRTIVERINTAVMLTWFQLTLGVTTGRPPGVPFSEFQSWIQGIQDHGLVHFEVKKPANIKYQVV